MIRSRYSVVTAAALFLGAVVVPLTLAGPAAAAVTTGPFTLDINNREDVRDFYNTVHEAANGVPDGWTGSIAGCNPGTVSADYLAATLSRINYFRTMAGEPDVTIPPSIEAPAAIFVDALDVRITTARRNVQLRFTVDGSQPTPSSPLVNGAIRLTSTGTVRARAYRGPRSVSPVVEATFTRAAAQPATVVAGTMPGLLYDLFEGAFSKLPEIEPLKPVGGGTVSGFILNPRRQDTNFAFRFTGFIDVPVTGVYRFFLRSDDGSRMWMDGALLVDNDGLHGAQERWADIALEKGLHPVVVGMFQQSGDFALGVSWSGPGLAKQVVPASALRHK